MIFEINAPKRTSLIIIDEIAHPCVCITAIRRYRFVARWAANWLEAAPVFSPSASVQGSADIDVLHRQVEG